MSILWNPSEGIALGDFTLRFYSLGFVIAFTLGWYIMKSIYINENESIEKLDSLFVYTVIATLLGARLGHVFFYDWEYFQNHLAEILLPVKFEPEFQFTGFTGLASHGAAIAIIIMMYIYSKKIIQKPILWVLDRIVIPVSLGAIFVRLGNFFNSEIIGHETKSVFGIRFLRDAISPQDAINITATNNVNEAYHLLVTQPQFASIINGIVPKHPTQLYEAFGYVFVFIILYFMYWKTNASQKQGLLFGLFLTLLWTIRFVVEFVKESQGGFEKSFGLLSTGQWLSLPFIIAGLYLLNKAKTVDK